MNMTELHTKRKLDARNGLTLRDAAGREVTCLRGSIWLTLEGDSRDILLEPGTSFVIDRDGLTVLAAQAPSEVCISAQNQSRRWWYRVMDLLQRTYGPPALRRDVAWKHYNERNR